MCAYMYICMHVIFKLGFERYGRGNCHSWEGKLTGGELSGGCPFPYTHTYASIIIVYHMLHKMCAYSTY